jgi:exonuclease I
MSINNDALIWIDLEMDGLDLTKNFILEIACIVTDFDLKNIHEGIFFHFCFLLIFIYLFFRSGSCYSSSKIFT